FGGSCLPKDLRAITYHARSHDVSTPLLNSLMFSNREQIEQGIAMVLASRRKKVGVLGFSFKAGTDDLRESPIVEVIERLIGKGFDLRLYDRNVNLAKLTGANREYIMKSIPHIERLMVTSVDAVLDHADVIVIGNSGEEFTGLADNLRSDQLVIDFVRIRQIEERHANYTGICW
ncbi:MAG TPA: UDP binding domain-containing protein, partial [Steroidobacteraceae bacterium]|nr:UDP binding domain-containing protein [Steroidobacteraceae bacterium]